MIIILNVPATQEDIKNATEHYPNYIKLTIDVEKEIVAIGGEYHFDAEQLLLKDGSKQHDIWGGGLDLTTGRIAFNAIINMRPSFENGSQEILDAGVRMKFEELVHKFLADYAKKQ